MTGIVASFMVLFLFALLAIPFVVLGVVLGAVLYVVGQILILPFRLLGGTIRLGTGVITGSMKLFMMLLVGLFSLVALLLGLFPLLTVVLICIGVWLIIRPFGRGAPRAARNHG